MGCLVIDAEELIAALQTYSDYELQYLLDLETGDVVLQGDGMVTDRDEELESLIEENPDRFRLIDPIPSDIGWQVMADFIEQLPAGQARAKLTRSVQLSHPFRRFKDTLLYYPGLRERWFAFEHRAMLELAREWLRDEGIKAELTIPDRIDAATEQ